MFQLKLNYIHVYEIRYDKISQSEIKNGSYYKNDNKVK